MAALWSKEFEDWAKNGKTPEETAQRIETLEYARQKYAVEEAERQRLRDAEETNKQNFQIFINLVHLVCFVVYFYCWWTR